MRISDWSSDVCSSDLPPQGQRRRTARKARCRVAGTQRRKRPADGGPIAVLSPVLPCRVTGFSRRSISPTTPLMACPFRRRAMARSEEHTSELQSLMRISYAVLRLKKKSTHHDYFFFQPKTTTHQHQSHKSLNHSHTND